LQSDAIKLHSDRAKKVTGELVTVYKKMKNTYTCTNIGLLFFLNYLFQYTIFNNVPSLPFIKTICFFHFYLFFFHPSYTYCIK
jgi:K+-sensing histidine kinase KdpD